jgi:hypothetical protein
MSCPTEWRDGVQRPQCFVRNENHQALHEGWRSVKDTRKSKLEHSPCLPFNPLPEIPVLHLVLKHTDFHKSAIRRQHHDVILENPPA